MGQKWQAMGLMGAVVCALSGCMDQSTGGGIVSRFSGGSEARAPAPKEGRPEIIGTLEARRSVLPASSSYNQVARAVLATNARAAEAELRAARLRSEAASKNWLPSIGPNISLSSLGDFVASLVVEQVLFDNGRKKAERAYAAADVEVAAVALSQDTNARVYEALDLYLTAEEGRADAKLAAFALKDMTHFEWVMNERVKGGVSNMSDLNIIRQKLSELRARETAATEKTNAALAELKAMSGTPLSGISGLAPVPMPGAGALSVLKAEAEAARSIAEAEAARAGALPGLKASATVTENGTTGGLRLGGDTLLGFGTPAQLKAIAAAKEGAGRKVAQAEEEARRARAGSEAQIAALDRQATEAAGMTAAAKKNLDLFQAQYDGGQRQVMDVVGVYESFVAQQRKEVTLKYDAARLRLKLARDAGQLVDGPSV